MTDPKTCAHPACTCIVTNDSEHGAYCSEHCKMLGDKTELVCECHLPGCE